MKKSLVALAVLAASGVASAQSTVTLYGLIDTYVGAQKTTVGGNGTRQSVVNSGGLQTSRFGLKGSEDLGGGLAANFQLENGFNVDTGATPNNGATNQSIFSRQSWVGLSGGFGQVKIGKMWTPFDEVKGSGAAGFDGNVLAPATNVWASNNYNDRPGNSLYYSTPSFGGFSAAAMYAFGENKTPTNNAGKTAGFNVAYNAGPLAAALSYQSEKPGGNAVGLAGRTTKFTQVNASYDFGVAKLLGAYGRVQDGLNPTRGFAVDKSTEYQIGVDVPLGGAFTLSGGYARSKDDQLGGAPEIKRKGYSIAGLYALSKRTNLYAGVQQAKENAYGPAVGGTPETKSSTYAVGVRHTF
ncbi:MAG: porin [Comamonadaceae bacterium]|nr:MAG: porin [Comamonadaceae bacterium]